ncbi:DUF6274 family protein [Streptomyces sp. NPDC048491]
MAARLQRGPDPPGSGPSRRLDGGTCRRYPCKGGERGRPPGRWSVAASARHETRALLRAHLSAALGYRHLTRHCAVCHRLLRLAMEVADPVRPEDESPPNR